MLALVNGQYKFRWVDAGTAGSCSDAQIFNACQLKRRIEDGRIGFPDPAPITQGGRDVPYFILADDAVWQFFGLGSVCYWVCLFLGWWLCLVFGLCVC